jgi:hypothetical protein
VRLFRTDQRGSADLCRHSFGGERDPLGIRLCVKPRGEGLETCGTSHRGEEMALEQDAFYIRTANSKILQLPFVPCSVLDDTLIEDLLSSSFKLTEVRLLFRDLLNAVEDLDSNAGALSSATLSHEGLRVWRENIHLPMRTPARIRTQGGHRPAGDPSSPMSTGQTPPPSTPPAPDVDLEYDLDDEAEEDWKTGGIPEGLLDHIRSLQVGLEKVSNATLLTHIEFGAMQKLQADDIRSLDVTAATPKCGGGQPVGWVGQSVRGGAATNRRRIISAGSLGCAGALGIASGSSHGCQDLYIHSRG